MNELSRYFSGTSNIVLPVRNKTFFPAEFSDKSRLTYYASLFTSLEVNSSFYKMPLGRTVSKWATEVPDNFRYTFKLIREVTHAAKCAFNLWPVTQFLEQVSLIGGKKGCLLIQLPPSFTVDLLQLGQLLALLADANSPYQWPVAIEFRHDSWYTDNVFSLLNQYEVAMVLQDMHRSRTPIELTTDQLVYLRFHGPEGGYRGSYADDVLYEYASYISEWLQEDRTVYVYFNNTMGAAVHNLASLDAFVRDCLSHN